jgi:hypothetical protein
VSDAVLEARVVERAHGVDRNAPAAAVAVARSAGERAHMLIA